MTADREQWNALARVWARCEPFGLCPSHLAPFSDLLRPPCLVVGSGLGLLVHGLRERGVQPILGVDQSVEMSRGALACRGVFTTVAALPDLPFRDQSFGSLVCATGVLEPSSRTDFDRSCKELSRLVIEGGTIAVGLFQPSHRLLRIGEDLGVFEGLTQRNDRLVALWNHRGDGDGQARCVAAWGSCSLGEARRRIARRRAFLNTWLGFLSGLADALSNEGLDAESYLGHAFSWTQHGLHPDQSIPARLPPEFMPLESRLYEDVSTRVCLFRVAGCTHS